MDRRKRSDDPSMSDYSRERTTDWRSAAPKWLILAWGTVGWVAGGFFGQIVWNQYQWRIEQVEQRAADPWKAQVGQLAYDVGITKKETEILKSRVEILESADARQQLMRLTWEVQRLNERLKKKGF